MSFARTYVAFGASILLALSLLAACSYSAVDDPPDDDDETPEAVNEENETEASEVDDADAEDEDSSNDDEDAGDDEESSEDDEATEDENGDEEESEYEGSAEVEVIESDIEVEVTSEGDYAPDSDVLIGIHGEIDPALYLISPDGDVQEAWRITNRFDSSMLDRRVLDNGNIMFVVRGDGAYEMNRDGEIVWEYQDSGISHHGEILPNGNVLVAGAICDCVQEIDYETREPVWYWDAHEAFPNYTESDDAFHRGEQFGMVNIFENAYDPDAEYPNTWGHVNYAQILENDNVIVSLRNFDTVLEVNRDGETVWSYGPGIIKHQHTPVDLEDGTMLVFDNGNHRAFRFDRGTGEILWSYDDLDSAIMGDVNLLDDGNYKVVDSLQNTVDVVSPEEELLWSMEIEAEGVVNGVYRVHMPDLED